MIVVGASGCYTTTMLKELSASHVGCREDAVVIANHEERWFGDAWDAECHGVKYLCSAHGRDVAFAAVH